MIDNLEIQNITTPIVETDKEDASILIAPNPVKENRLAITVTGDLKVKRIHISDIAGRRIHSQKIDLISKEGIEILVDELESGVYHALFETDGIWITKPFLKL